ncbi:hypothetical protein [Nesterenkonia suensis]
MDVCYVPAVSLEALPAELPAESAVSDAASRIGSHATTVRSRYDDAATSWGKLADGRFDTPQAEEVHSAFQRLVLPDVENYETAAESVKNALVSFQDAVDLLRSSIVDVRSQAAAENAVPPEDRDDAYWIRVNDLQVRINGLGEQYDQAVADCVNALQGSHGSSGPPAWPGMMSKGFDGLSGANRGLTNTLGDAALMKPYWKDGRLMSFFGGDGLSGASAASAAWLARRAGVPDSYIQRFSEAAGGGRRVSNNETSAMLRDAAKGSSVLGFALRRVPGLKNMKLNFNGDKVNMRLQLSESSGPPRDTGKSSTAMRNAVNRLEDISNSKAMRGLGVAGLGFGAYGNYNQGYNDSLKRNPGASEAEHRQAAAVDAGVKTSAEAVGAAAGAKFGAVGGAAVGQVLIPIPGVGAAIGGVVGGVAGSAVGGWLGGAFGEGMNDSRHNGGHIGEQIIEGGKNVLDSLNPFS